MADSKGRLVLKDISGGRNGYDPPWDISANECVEAVNVDCYGTRFARKVGGAANQSGLSGATTAGVYSSLGRHVPGTNPTAAELWATDDSGTPVINRLAGGTAWSAPTIKDAPTGNGWDFSYATINGKFFMGYQSAQPRMHLWDASTVRRAGLAAPAVPTISNTTSALTMMFDAAGTLNFGATTTFTHVCGASATVLLVFTRAIVAGIPTAVTYNGVAMTQINSNSLGTNFDQMWYLVSPTVGSHSVSLTTGGGNISAMSVSYTNARITGVPDASDLVSGSPATLTGVITTVSDSDWVIFGVSNDTATPTAGAGSTLRASVSPGAAAVFDSNGGVTPPGVTSLSATVTAGSASVGLLAALTPALAGLAVTQRYYRVRWTRQIAGITLGRSEPGTSVAFTPNGSNSAARVTQPSVANEGETHWEVEGSIDNVTFYRIATVAIGTTTYDDSSSPSTYSSSPISALTGTYTLLPSAKFIAADQGRLLTFGSYTPADKQNDIIVSAVIGSLDVSDEERVDTNTNYRIGLDENDSGVPTGLIGPVNNSYIAFKDRQSWLLTATGTPAQPYRQDVLSKTVGAVCATAMDRGEDESGNACIYWMSHRGPYRWGQKGVEYIGRNVEDYVLPKGNSQAVMNLAATKVVSAVRFFPDLRQVWFWWATGSSNDPNQLFKFDITSGGWTQVPTGDGPANVRCAVSFSDTIGATMSRTQKLYVGQALGNNRLWKMETGTDYAGTTFKSYIITGDVEPGSPGYSGHIGEPLLLAKAAAGVTITNTATYDYGVAAAKTGSALLTAIGSETRVQVVLRETGHDDASFVHYQIGDASATADAWTLERLVVPVEKGRALSA